MTKREYKLWRRRMRQLNKAARDERREWEAKHAGSFNFDTNVAAFPFGAGPIYSYNSRIVSRVRQKGDFVRTTPYEIQVGDKRGCSLLQYQWFRDIGTSHTSGYASKSVGIQPAVWWGGYSDTSSMRASLNNLTQSALLAKILSGAPSWDVSTDLAEGKQTVGLLRSSAATLINLASMVKRRDYRGIAGFLKLSKNPKSLRRLRGRIYARQSVNGYGVTVGSCLSNMWMQYRYGFMPMIYSMQDAMIAFNAEFAKGVKLTEQVTIMDSLSFNTSYDAKPSTGFYTTDKTRRTCSGSIRKKAYFNYTNSMVDRLIGNPFATVARTVWEVVPFSFVVDWFIGIGDYLDNLQVDTLVPTADVNVSEMGTTLFSFWWETVKPPTGYRHAPINFFGNKVDATNFRFVRSRGNLSVPPIDLSQSWYTFKRSIDTAAMSWQKFNKHLNQVVEPDGFKYRIH